MQKLPRLGAATAATLLFFSCLPLPEAASDPATAAPAWGWREQHDRDRDRDAARVEATPAAVPHKFCARDLIGAALGGAAGGVIGSNIGRSSGRTAATAGGVLLGLFVGGAIGRTMDRTDQACHPPDGGREAVD
jgi:hypothetical protein